MSDLEFEPDVALAGLTTIGVGGSARLLVRVHTHEEIRSTLAKAKAEQLQVLVLGGGSNLVVADAGVDGLVLVLQNQEIECLERSDDSVLLKVGAGCIWDDFVEYCVKNGFSGVECLSGIPGCMGAAPIQNIGAYGQEVAQVIESVICVSRTDGTSRKYSSEDCGFGYRTSHFKKGELKTEIVTHVEVRLSLGPPASPLYPELIRACGKDCRDLKILRETVIELRRKKSMIYDPNDPNHRSAGSFFVNPIVSPEVLNRVRLALKDLEIQEQEMPCFAQEGGGYKLSAAWLMDRAGFNKGFGDGAVGLSTNHCLAIVNRGGARADEIWALVTMVQKGVMAKFGVELVPEPVFWG